MADEVYDGPWQRQEQANHWRETTTGAYLARAGAPGTQLAELAAGWLHIYLPGGRGAPGDSPVDQHTAVISWGPEEFEAPDDDEACWQLVDEAASSDHEIWTP